MNLRLAPGMAGVDEAGRGPLAGPLFVAAVILPEGIDVCGLNDSKKLTAAAREECAARILASCHTCIVEVCLEKIETLNILGATLYGMAESLRGLGDIPARALIDGNKVPTNAPCDCEAVIAGDATFACIAAASILAKTARDACMREWGKKYPQYGFERHMGYATPEHLAALREHGPCPIHRRSFAPIREFDLQPCLEFAG